MKLLNIFYLGSLFLLSHSVMEANSIRSEITPFEKAEVGDLKNQILKTRCGCRHYSPPESHYGSAGFSVTDPNLWYTITTHSYPEMTPLSEQRNHGLQEGGVYLSPTGFTIGEEGDYWVNITAVLVNPGDESILVPVFLVQDETFDPDSDSQVGGVVTLAPGVITTMQGTGILQDIYPGTRLSLVATNGGDPFPQDVTVVGWFISLFKLP